MTSPAARFELHLDIDSAGMKPAPYLADAGGLSIQQVKQAMQKGAVWLARHGKPQRLRRAGKVLKAGDRLHFYYDAEILAAEPPAARLIADEDAYSVWFKPGSMPVQGSRWGDHCTITRWAEQHLHPERNAYIVHRLDRAASGLLLLAHHKQVAAALAALFQARAVEKHYRALVEGEFPGASPRQEALQETTEEITLDTPIDGREAISRVRRLAFDPVRCRSLLAVNIETGRKHQIRRHLADRGFPIVGDRLYGNTTDDEDLQLSACRLAFQCPVSGVQKSFVLPAD
ncbi:RNA pseudouridine synthase [Exilibacterium tricleocarpae]|uniref:RNA pseudouridine synthase n=1 Tax=Exilibacterium tricleocarpae TaxID=2591008 RepID=A0A545SME4_9GAMM|nr:RNA pseudouridine synthase [Exilibacterium tricleocarpae]TQV66145.1 RNA pseudouridine synthase [Exilibacterium tricleocarpae]